MKTIAQYLFVTMQYVLPHNLISRMAGWFAESRCAWWKNFFITRFVRRYKVDMSSAVEPELRNYENFNAFFTRALRHDARSVDLQELVVTSPVDGVLYQSGGIHSDQLLQAKKKYFSLEALLTREEYAKLFNSGSVSCLYLRPKDYHRIHMPIAGDLREMIYVPGRLFSVNPATVNHVSNLFARNERVICLFDTVVGPLAMVLVGAMIVGSVETVWAGKVAPRHPRRVHEWVYEPGEVSLQKGEELGRFRLGSTVIMCFGPGAVAWCDGVSPGSELHMGQKLGTIIN